MPARVLWVYIYAFSLQQVPLKYLKIFRINLCKYSSFKFAFELQAHIFLWIHPFISIIMLNQSKFFCVRHSGKKNQQSTDWLALWLHSGFMKYSKFCNLVWRELCSEFEDIKSLWSLRGVTKKKFQYSIRSIDYEK